MECIIANGFTWCTIELTTANPGWYSRRTRHHSERYHHRFPDSSRAGHSLHIHMSLQGRTWCPTSHPKASHQLSWFVFHCHRNPCISSEHCSLRKEVQTCYMLGGLLQLRGLTSGTRELTQKSHKVFGTYNTTDSMQGQPNW